MKVEELNGDKVWQLRTMMGMTAKQLGVELGVTANAVHNWENSEKFYMKDEHKTKLISLATERGLINADD